MASTATSRVLQAITAEREAQTRQWGVQHHADSDGDLYLETYEGLATAYKTLNTGALASGHDPSWPLILLEEVYEALAEGANPEALEKELIQVGAVCVAWVEDLRSRSGRATAE